MNRAFDLTKAVGTGVHEDVVFDGELKKFNKNVMIVPTGYYLDSKGQIRRLPLERPAIAAAS